MENTNNKTLPLLFHAKVLPIVSGATEDQQNLLQSWLDGMDKVADDKANRQSAFVSLIMQKLLGYQANNIVLAPTEIAENAIDLLVGSFSSDNELATLAIGITQKGPLISEEEESAFSKSAWKFKDFSSHGFYMLTSLGEIRLYPASRKDKAYERFVFNEIVNDQQALARMCLLLKPENLLSGQTASWYLDSTKLALDEKLKGSYKTLKELYGSVKQGISSDIDDAFIISTQTRADLVKKDPRSDEVIKQFAQHKDHDKWLVDAANWIIYLKPGQDIKNYPAINEYLSAFRDRLEARKGDQKWYELPGEIDESGMFREKLGFSARSHAPTFAIDRDGLAYDAKGFYTDEMDYYLVALLNSSVLWYLVRKASKPLEDGTYEIPMQAIEQLPIPDAPGLVRGRMGQLSDYCQEAAGERNSMIKHFRGMTAFNLLPGGLEAELTPVLKNWFSHDFDTFRSEIIESFKTDIPSDDLQLWTDYFDQERNRVFSTNAGLARAEKEIDVAVYELFGLTPDEIDIVERFI